MAITTLLGTEHVSNGNHVGVLPSKANGKASNMEDGPRILDIAASFIRALDYRPPPFPQDPVLTKAVVQELESWDIGPAVDGFMKCVDVGIAAAEVYSFFVTQATCRLNFCSVALLPFSRIRSEDYHGDLHGVSTFLISMIAL